MKRNDRDGGPPKEKSRKFNASAHRSYPPPAEFSGQRSCFIYLTTNYISSQVQLLPCYTEVDESVFYLDWIGFEVIVISGDAGSGF